MKICSIFLYSHQGDKRVVPFNIDGLNIITGKSSTGKSAIAEIIEYCMGRSSFNVPEGVIRDKVAWFGVIFQFDSDQLLVAKPTPSYGHTRCSTAMVRRGADLQIPDFAELSINSDDDTVVAQISTLLGIPSNVTDVPIASSRDSYAATVKHTFFYLFQKQGLITNKDQLFYRQNEPHMPMSIKDTLPILLGVSGDDRYQLETKLRIAKRDLKLHEKLIAEAKTFADSVSTKGISLLSEAKQVGIVSFAGATGQDDDLLRLLREAVLWTPETGSDENTTQLTVLEDELKSFRNERAAASESLEAVKLFAEKEEGFSSEAKEQKDRLESIKSLPRNKSTGEWQWPFAEKNLGMDSPISEVLIEELQSLETEMDVVFGERPKLQEYIREVSDRIVSLTEKIEAKNSEVAAAISANEMLAAMENLNNAAAKVVGRISLFLENYQSDDSLKNLELTRQKLQRRVDRLEADVARDDSEARMASILNIISTQMGKYVQDLGAEFAGFPFRLDLQNLTVVIDRPDRPVPMFRTGGGANHLAYHIAAFLSLHRYSCETKRPIPKFLLIDQPTQVYFPSETVYEAVGGSVERTEKDSDLESVRRLFHLLYKFTVEDCPGFQIIVTEHANLRDEWFQKAIVETPWTKPPALVPEDWPDSEDVKSKMEAE